MLAYFTDFDFLNQTWI